MNRLFQPSRRRFLEMGGLGLLAASAAPSWLRAMEMQTPFKGAANKANPAFKPDVEIELIAKKDALSILKGQETGVFRYVARLINGPKEVLTDIPGSYLGPIIRLNQGQKVRVHFHNQLPEESITHWHGLHVPSDMDGHPRHAIGYGETRVYEFEVLNRASFNIYHPHPHGKTASQVYYGLAGGLIINDSEEARLGLPSGEFEIPLVIQDRRFDGNNQLVYGANMHDRMVGFYGDEILVNGRPRAEFEVATRAYRLRIMNGSNARIYKLGWSNGSPLTVIGVDGGLLEKPETRPYVMLAPGERLDVWADFGAYSRGTEITLRSLPFRGVLPKMAEHRQAGGMGGMHANSGESGHAMGGGSGMGMMGGSSLAVGSDFPILKVRVTRAVSDSPDLPSRLSSFKTYRMADVANLDHPIPIGISESMGSMILNGHAYGEGGILPGERVPVDTLQALEIFHAHGGAAGGGHAAAASSHGQATEAGAGGDSSASGMSHSAGGPGGMGGMRHGMMGGMNHGSGGSNHAMGGMGGMGGMGMMFSMAHPIHLHGQQFQVISRSIGAEETEDYATVKEGLISSGLKDTVLVMPGERVKIIKPFGDFKGTFMYHCHNLEHEDMGMMREFEIY